MNSSSDSLPTVDRFGQILVRSGLLNREELRRLIDAAPGPVRRDTKQLADYLIDRQHLTHFQATKLLKGTWQGLVLGPYQVLAPLGRGGMGSVYLARNIDFGKKDRKTHGSALIALKVLPPKRAKEEERTLARFLREMDMCQRVNHPHLTQTFDAGQIQGVYYIAMEYIRGVSLTQAVKDGGPLLVPRAAHLFSEVAAGLAHAHEKGLIHRDLKPSNIMVTPNGHAKILDLGLALVVDEELPLDKRIVGGQGYVVGTMDYIAPEQVDDAAQVDARADLYALGCTMYFALTGQPPFPGGTSVEKMKRHRTEFPDPVTALNPTIPSEFSGIIEKLMKKSPARRFRSAEELREALLPWAAGDPDRPLDVDPHVSEAEAVQQLEQTQSAEPEIWWEAVPVISFEATAKHSAKAEKTKGSSPKVAIEPAEDEADAPPKTGLGYSLLKAALIVVGIVALVLMMEWMRR